jgi:hypothetical protein
MKRLCLLCKKAERYCTNGRCQECHRKHCTPGGDTSPGHGMGDARNGEESD